MTTIPPFHPGEIAVQHRTGEEKQAIRNGQIISHQIAGGALRFVDKQPMVVLSSLDGDGAIWTSLLAGKPGFVVAESPERVRLTTDRLVSARDDIFWTNIRQQSAVGMLFIELSSRRRMRVNGQLTADGLDFVLTVGEAFANCPQYIQRREIAVTAPHGLPDAPTFTGTKLTAELTDWIGRADTFFVGTAHDADHLDASHRGGNPGFVQVENNLMLLIPDYRGNSMFMTLGNLTVNPKAGLLCVNFETGETLQLTGRAELLFGEPGQTDDTGGTGRHWRFHLQSWRRQASLRSVSWAFVDYSPYNV